MIPEDRATRKDDTGLEPVARAELGGAFGGLIEIVSWAVIDMNEAFGRDAKRRQWARRIAFAVTPLPREVAASVMATI